MNRKLLVNSLAAFAVIAVLSACPTAEAQPRDAFHPEFPPDGGNQLSPPIVYRPIYECAEAVHVSGFIPHAKIQVFANAMELVGEAEPNFGFTDVPITLNRPLKFDETVTAKQTIGGLTSGQSIHPVKVVHRVAGGLPMPKVHPKLFECGRIVPVDEMTESARVKIFDGATVIGSEPTAGKWQPIWTTPLVKNRGITAQLFECEHLPMMAVVGPMSAPPVNVAPAPSPLPAPIVPKEQQIAGSDIANVYGLLVGAHVTVRDRGAEIGSGYATAEGNRVPLKKRLETASVIEVTQELCAVASPPSPPVSPEGKLEAPLVLSPICDGQQYAVVRKTTVNATVIIFRNGGVVGYGGAENGDAIIALGGGAKFVAGDNVTARQFMGPTLSGASPPVNVVRRPETPALEIVNGESFFEAESGEEQIEGPVFPRGRQPGPKFLIQSCCTENGNLRIEMEDGTVVAKLPLKEIFPGYHTAEWDWHSSLGWAVPQGIPVGKYFAVASTSCAQAPARKPFFIIFNPVDVNGPSRFSFDETGVWFATGNNSTRALLYHLHPDDRRVFDRALKAANGATDPADAAQRIVDFEESLFGYDLGYHGNDVLNMLLHESEAQCADDANVLTAFLRAVGIPAHPVTADAALETEAADWTFDTWTEFLAPFGGAPEWRIYHPHQYESMGAETRQTFGQRGVANKGFNDLVVMADENWDWTQASDGAPDVTFARQTCGEPNEVISKAFWIREVCEEGYWSPDNHWSCPRALRASALTANFAAPPALLEWGGDLATAVRLKNTNDATFNDEVVVEVVADLPESKRFPDEVLSRTRLPVKIARRGEWVEHLKLELPKTHPAGTSLYLHVKTGATTIHVEPLEIRPRVGVRVEGPRRLRAGERGEFQVTVTGSGEKDVSNVRLTAQSPRGLKLSDDAERRIDTLKTAGKSVFNLNVTAESVLHAGHLVVDVQTDDGGSVRTFVPLVVEEERRFELPIPVFTPKP